MSKEWKIEVHTLDDINHEATRGYTRFVDGSKYPVKYVKLDDLIKMMDKAVSIMESMYKPTEIQPKDKEGKI